MFIGKILAVLALWMTGLAGAATGPAVAPEPSKPPALLEEIFQPLLRPEQLASLGDAATPERMASLMDAAQKELARTKLRQLEAQGAPEELRPQLAEGYRLLGFDVDALRLRSDTSVPAKAQALTAAASQALVKGENEAAIRLAAEALAADPTDENANAILMLSQRRLVPPEKLRSLGLPEGFAPPSTGSAVEVPPDYAQPRPPTPQALSLMRQVVEARRAGDLDRTLALALEAMRADPTCAEVQELFNMVREDRAKSLRKVRETLGYLDQAVAARKAGRWPEAVEWAEKAALSDPDPVVLRLLADMRQGQASAAMKKAEAAPTAPQPKRNPWTPLLPLGAAAAGAAAYSVHTRRRAWSEQEFGRAAEDDPEVAAQKLYELKYKAKVTAGAALVLGGGLLLWETAPAWLPFFGAGAARYAPQFLQRAGEAAQAQGIGLQEATVLLPVAAIGAKTLADATPAPSWNWSFSQADPGNTNQQTARRPTPKEGTGKPGVSRAPRVSDPELQRELNQLYRPGADIGNGGTADALRYEMDTGRLLSKAGHGQKARERAARLKTWLDRHPEASRDRAIALREWNDLIQALAGN